MMIQIGPVNLQRFLATPPKAMCSEEFHVPCLLVVVQVGFVELNR